MIINNICLLKIIYGVLSFSIILLAGWYPLSKHKIMTYEHDHFTLGDALATGIFLGAALLHMLPESARLLDRMHYHYPFAFIITGFVFLLFLWFEHLGKALYHDQHHPAFAVLAWGMLSIHSLTLGAALGVTQNHSIAFMLFLAIITHKWAESFSIAMQLAKSTLSFQQAIIFFISFAFMTPLGIILGYYFQYNLSSNSLLDPLFLAIAAGTFLYLGTLHGLERCVLVKECCDLKNFSFVIIGFVMMSCVAILA